MQSQSLQLQSLGLFHYSIEVGRLEVGSTEGKKKKIRPGTNFSFFHINIF